MKQTINLICILFIVFSLTACSNTEESSVNNVTQNSSDENNILKVWVSQNELELTQEMCEMFLKQYGYDSLRIECVGMPPYDAAYTLTYDWDTAADVLQYSTTNGKQLVEAGLLLPITLNYDDLQNRFDSKAFNACSFDGLLYGIPTEPYTGIMYYNKSIFSEEDVKSLEQMLNKDTPIPYNFSYQIHNSWYIDAFYYAMGCTLFGEDGMQADQCTWNNADGYEASRYLINLVKNPSYYENLESTAIDYFKEGELGAFCANQEYATELKDILGDDLGITKLPVVKIADADRQLRTFVEYNAFGVKTYTKYPKEAQELAEWLGNEACQMMRYEAIGTTPTLTELYTNDLIAKDAVANAVITQLEYSVIIPPILQMDSYWDPAIALGEGILEGVVTEENLQHYLDLTVENITTKLASQ